MVSPPFIILSPWRYFASCAFALSRVTGTPFVISPGIGIVAVEAAKLAACEPGHHTQPGSIHCGPCRKRVNEAHISSGESRSDVGFGYMPAQVDAEFERALRLQRNWLYLQDYRSCYTVPWKVRLITSNCCSRVNRTKLTA